MDVIGMVDSLPEQSKNELILSFLGATVFALEASNPVIVAKRLQITAARFGLLYQFRKECAEYDAREADRNKK